MTTLFAKAPAEKMHPLAAELRSVLQNPNASLGELASVVQRTLAELQMFEAQDGQQDPAGKSGKTGKRGATAMSADDASQLRQLISAMTGQSRRSQTSR